MQMTCEWLECICVIGEVYVLTHLHLGLGIWDREDRINQSNISRGPHTAFTMSWPGLELMYIALIVPYQIAF